MNRSLRIAFLVNPFRLRRGGADHAPVLSRELLGRGHRCRGFGAPPGVIPRSRADVGEDGLGLMGYDPDVIVAYDALSPAGWHGARIARRLRIPLVAVEEGLAPSTGRLAGMLRGYSTKLWAPRLERTVARLVALDVVARAQAIQRGYGAERVEVLSPGVDLSRYRPSMQSELLAGHGVGGHALLVTSPLEEGRGLEQVLEAFGQTVGRREDWALVFAGDGPYRAALRAHAARLGVGAHVHWIGAPREEELPGLMGAATLLLVPGQDSATAARHLRLAMACGLPALAVDEPRFAELVEDDGTGILINRTAHDGWLRSLEHAARNPRSRERWGARARELAEQRFAWPQIAAQFASLLGEVVAAGPEPEPSRRPSLLRRRA